MAKNSNKIKSKSTADRIFGAAVIILSIVVFIAIAYPLWFIVIASISNSNLVNLGKVTIWPKDIRFYGYIMYVFYFQVFIFMHFVYFSLLILCLVYNTHIFS